VKKCCSEKTRVPLSTKIYDLKCNWWPNPGSQKEAKNREEVKKKKKLGKRKQETNRRKKRKQRRKKDS